MTLDISYIEANTCANFGRTDYKNKLILFVPPMFDKYTKKEHCFSLNRDKSTGKA